MFKRGELSLNFSLQINYEILPPIFFLAAMRRFVRSRNVYDSTVMLVLYTVMKQMFKYDTFIMHHVSPQMCYYRRCAIWSASFHLHNAHWRFLGVRYSFWYKETWGRRCDINTADAALQFMSCTRVTRLSLRALHFAEALLFAVCVSTSRCDGSNRSSQGYSPLATHYMNTQDLEHLI